MVGFSFKLITALAFGLLFCIQPTFSLVLGGSHGGGGSGATLQTSINKRQRLCAERAVASAVKDPFFRKSVLIYLSKLSPVHLQNPVAQKTLKAMQDQGLAKDIINTKFRLSENCLDEQGSHRSASTPFAKTATVCLSPAMIVKDLGTHIDDSVLYGLMAHEFSHHFGFKDTQIDRDGEEVYPLGSAVAEFAADESLDYVEEAYSGNNFVRLDACRSMVLETSGRDLSDFDIEF